MDPGSMYRDDYHPILNTKKSNWNGTARHCTRTERPPRYYFIDFGISRRYNPNIQAPLEVPIRGGDKTAPEHQGRLLKVRCDPFPTDVYYLGHCIEAVFLNVRE